MGRIKTQFVKRTSNDLIKKHPERFNADFEHNKKTIAQVTDVQSKKVRNVIAGYIGRLVRNKKEY
ncbi:MAG: 30S ribosomal protein S17e [Candidatus Woesearchaeota archaeon]